MPPFTRASTRRRSRRSLIRWRVAMALKCALVAFMVEGVVRNVAGVGWRLGCVWGALAVPCHTPHARLRVLTRRHTHTRSLTHTRTHETNRRQTCRYFSSSSSSRPSSPPSSTTSLSISTRAQRGGETRCLAHTLRSGFTLSVSTRAAGTACGGIGQQQKRTRCGVRTQGDDVTLCNNMLHPCRTCCIHVAPWCVRSMLGPPAGAGNASCGVSRCVSVCR